MGVGIQRTSILMLHNIWMTIYDNNYLKNQMTMRKATKVVTVVTNQILLSIKTL
jgi:hypothetical protein